MPDQFLPGYLLYAAVILLPGLGFGELFNLWKKYESISQRIALGIGLGLTLDTVVFALRDYGPVLFGLPPEGIGRITIYFLLFIGLGFLSGAVVSRRKFLLPKKPVHEDVFLLGLIVVLCIMVEMYLAKFPIFPEFQSGDYSVHATYAELIASGSSPSGVGVLYQGVRFQLAAALLLIGGEALITVRDAIAVLVVLSPLLFYLASKEIFDNPKVAIICTTLYTLTATIWFVSVFNSGLYANFFGIMIVLFLIVSIKWLIEEPKSKTIWLTFLMVLFTAYYSHYSTITIIPALFVIALIEFWRDRSKATSYLLPAALLILPLFAVFIARPAFFGYLLQLAINGGGSVSNSTYLSNLLSGIPVLKYMAAEVSDDIGLIVLWFFAAICAYSSIRSKKFGMLPFFWFASLLIAAPFGISAWRFSFEALLPLTLMAGYGMFIVASSLNKKMSLSHNKLPNIRVIIIVLLFLLPILYGSWGNRIITDSISNAHATAKVQNDVYSSIYWLKYNTPTNSTYLSLTDWRMTYTNLMIGRPTYFKYFSEQNQSIQYADKVGARYIIVTRQTTLNLPPLPQFHPWNSFVNESGFTQVYSNADVRIYKLG